MRCTFGKLRSKSVGNLALIGRGLRNCTQTRSFCIASGYSSLQTQSVPRFITCADLAEIDGSGGFLNSRKFVDVRNPDDFEVDHIDGAVNIREIFTYLQNSSDTEGMKEMQDYFYERFTDKGISGLETEHLIVYEQSLDKMLGVSCRGWFISKFMGHPNVSVLLDGMDGFDRLTDDQKTKLIGRNDNVIKPTEYLGLYGDEQARSLMADRFDVLKVINDDNNKTVLLDTRSECEWKGTHTLPGSVNPELRCGRLPGAVWCEWTELIQRNHENPAVSKSREEIRSIMKERGVTPEDEIIVYCYKGARASNTLMLLKEAGFDNVRNYFGSWQEWARDPELPIDGTILD